MTYTPYSRACRRGGGSENKDQTTVPAFDAIRGQRSAYAMQLMGGPADEGHEETYAFLCHRACDGGALHLTLWVDDNASVVLKSFMIRFQYGIKIKLRRTSK